jgi:DNA topoisomerase IB
MPRTRRVDCSEPGIARRRHGRGFVYLHADGARVAHAQTLARIRALAIPPAWEEVWICRDPRGHIQATGIDDAGRKQYRYHEDWSTRRAAAKFEAMLAFGEALPQLRRRVARDLRGDALDETRVHAGAVRLLDVGFFRIGSEDYAQRNGSYGLTTLLDRHVRVQRDGLLFDFPAKSGQRRRQLVTDPGTRRLVAALKRRRGGGPELLAYKHAGRWVDVKAEGVNAYLKDAAGADVSSKDFRTWNATALCAAALAARAAQATSRSARTRLARSAIDEVALLLGNTPAVCRASYVDPRVLDRFHSGHTIAATLVTRGEPRAEAPIRAPSIDERVRRAVLELITG